MASGFAPHHMNAIHSIPPAPRRPLWRAVLWHRWPIALASFVLAVYGGLWALMLWFAAGGKPSDDARLDERPAVARGTITVVEAVDATWHGGPVDRVGYRFASEPAREQVGWCFVSRGSCDVGDEVAVEFDDTEPSISRVHGGRIGLIRLFAGSVFTATVVPGIACLLLWLFGVTRLHRVLAHGDIAVAEIVSVARLRFVQPSMLDVRFRFRDHHARVVEGRHWVRERSLLGARVQRRPAVLPVAHDRARPSTHRLVVPDYFEVRTRVRVPDRLPENL